MMSQANGSIKIGIHSHIDNMQRRPVQTKFAADPELERQGWEKRIALDDVISYDRYREASRPDL